MATLHPLNVRRERRRPLKDDNANRDWGTPNWKTLEGFTKLGYAFVKTKEFTSSVQEIRESRQPAEEKLKNDEIQKEAQGIWHE